MEQTEIRAEDRTHIDLIIQEIKESIEVIERVLNSGAVLTKQEARLLSKATKGFVAVRNADICKSIMDGEKQSFVARKWNLTPARVTQLSKRVSNTVLNQTEKM